MCLLQLRAQTSHMYPTAAGAWRLRGPDEALLVAVAGQPLSMQHVNCEGGVHTSKHHHMGAAILRCYPTLLERISTLSCILHFQT